MRLIPIIAFGNIKKIFMGVSRKIFKYPNEIKGMAKNFGAVTIILIIFLVLRLCAQIVSAWLQLSNTFVVVTVMCFAVLYAASLVGVVKKQKWGSTLAMVIGVIDILFALALGGAVGIGAGIADLLLIWLGYMEFRGSVESRKPVKKK